MVTSIEPTEPVRLMFHIVVAWIRMMKPSSCCGTALVPNLRLGVTFGALMMVHLHTEQNRMKMRLVLKRMKETRAEVVPYW